MPGQFENFESFWSNKFKLESDPDKLAKILTDSKGAKIFSLNKLENDLKEIDSFKIETEANIDKLMSLKNFIIKVREISD